MGCPQISPAQCRSNATTMSKRSAILLPVIAIMLSLLMGCNNEKRQLRLLIKELNSECPIDLGAMGSMDEILFSNNTVSICYTVSEMAMNNLGSISDGGKAFHDYMLENYRNNNDEGFRQLLESIINAGADLEVRFHHNDGEWVAVKFYNEELSDNMPEYGDDPDRYLESALVTNRMQLPISYGEGITCTSIDMDDAFFSYYLNCDESILNIAEMQQSVVDNHEAMVDMITSSTDPSFIKMMSMLKSTRRGLQSVYIGNISGEKAIVTIQPEEL